MLENRQTALLSTFALNYNPRTEWREKRLTRYYSYLWRCRAHDGNFAKPLKVSTILREGLGLEVDERRLAKERDDFAKVHSRLFRDGVILDWRYAQRDGEWPEWTVTIEPPELIQQHYQKLSRARAGPFEFRIPATERENLGNGFVISARRYSSRKDV